MKKTLLLCLIIPMLLGSCTQEKVSPMEGAWKLAYEYEYKGDNSTMIFPGTSQGSEIKMWSGDRWALVGVFIEDSTITDNFGGGNFTLEGTNYQEIVEFHSATEYLGQTVKLFLEIQNDTLIQIWPVDDNGEIIKSHYYMEKWVRME
ncbi:MAG: hypothetical protein KAR16_11515 [Bacteroidales bacterium]|nr:hypothetical protein [Bacteroidales bacterium]